MSEHYDEAALTLEELEDRIRDGEATVDQLLSWSSIHASLASIEAIREQTAVLRGAQDNVVNLLEVQERAIAVDTQRLAAATAKRRRWGNRTTPAPTEPRQVTEAASGGEVG